RAPAAEARVADDLVAVQRGDDGIRDCARPLEVLLAPALEGLGLEVVAFRPRDVGGDLPVDLVDGPLEVGALGERDELDAFRSLGGEIHGGCVEGDLVFAAGLPKAAVP